MGECLWEGWVDENGRIVIPKLDDNEKNSIQHLFKGRERFDASNITISDNPALRKLEEYYGKRLKEIIDPGGDKNVVADHAIYHKIYRSQLGKNVIGALSSYCLDARGDDFLVEKDPQRNRDTRKENLKKLETTSTTESGNTNMAYGHWSGCAFNIQHICYNTCREKEGAGKKYCCKENCDNDTLFQHSQSRACEVVDYIKAIRQNLLVLDKIDEQWEERKSTGVAGFDGNVVHEVEIEKITSLNSRQVVEQSGYTNEQKNIVEEMEECLKNFDPRNCSKFVGVEKEGERALDEQSFRTRVLQEKIDLMKKSDKREDSLEQYLRDEGYSKEEISKMLQDGKVSAEMISQRFKEKRAALQRSLKEKLENTSADPNDPQDTKDTLQNLRDEAARERQRLGELVFFTNMVSGFLKIGDEEGNVLGNNSESLQQELKDGLFSSEESANKLGLDFKALQESGNKAAPLSNKQNTQEQRNLEVETINELLLNYD